MSEWASECGTVRLIHGDALAVLPTLDISPVVVTDPPYGIHHRSNGQWFKNANRCSGDEDTELLEWTCDWADARGLPLICFYSSYQPPRVQWRNVLVWSKGEHVGVGGDRETCWKRDHELIGVKNNGDLAGRRDSSVLRFNALGLKPSGHFCEKPVPLMRYLVEKVAPTDTLVLDPFMGSGTTGVACVQTGRRFIGIELDEGYFDIARRRIERALRDRSELLPMGEAVPA